MNKDLAIFEELRDIVASRVNHYQRQYVKKRKETDFDKFQTYQSCLNMIEYALDGSWDCLKEFDYYED